MEIKKMPKIPILFFYLGVSAFIGDFRETQNIITTALFHKFHNFFFIHQYLLITVTCVRIITSPWIRSTLDVGQILFYSCWGPGVGVVAHKYVAIRRPQFYFLDDEAAYERSDPQVTEKWAPLHLFYFLLVPNQNIPIHSCANFTHQKIKAGLISQFCYYFFPTVQGKKIWNFSSKTLYHNTLW